MLQLRPTFSESWYRVVGLKPKLRGTAQISRQYYRGERWYVVRDAASNQFHRLSDAAYRFVGLLDGTRTVGDAWDLVGGQLADDAPTQPEVIQILSQLYAANLVETDIPPDATVLLRRHKKQMQRRLQSRLMNVLFPRIPLWDCDRFLCRWLPLAKLAYSKIGAIIWFLVVGIALTMVAPEWPRLKAQTIEAMNLSAHPSTFLWGLLVFWIIKFIHECGHAFSCRRFGGEVHEMGIMFLVFVPTPYVDASTAWSFSNRWARMFVGAAGMITEVFVAAICAIAWVYVNPNGAGAFISNMLCYAMIIASFTTVVFNANPLLRYDGYYILSDYLEIPNLQMKSREYLLGLIKRHIFRLKSQQPLPPPGQRALLGVYGVLSTIYRVFVGIMIILVVTWSVPVIGVLMAIGGVCTWLVVPLVKLFKYLTIDPELHRKRGRAWAFTAVMAVLIVNLIGVISFPMHIAVQGIAEPEFQQVLHAATPGRVIQIPAKDGQILRQGDPILICENMELLTQMRQLESQIAQGRAQILRYEGANEMNRAAGAQIELSANIDQLGELKKQVDALTIRAPFDGMLISPELRHLQGRYLPPGAELGQVAKMDTLRVVAVVEQKDAQLYKRYNPVADNTQVKLVGSPMTVLYPRKIGMIDGAVEELPHPSLGDRAGGTIATDPRDQNGTRTRSGEFQLQAIVANPDGTLLPGQGAWVRLELGREALLEQWTRRFLQLVTAHETNSQWF